MQVYCYIYVLLLTKCFLKLSFAEAEHQCYSCFSYCKTLPNGSINIENCDCTGQFCTSEHCFAKIEIFAEEQTAIIQVKKNLTRKKNFFVNIFAIDFTFFIEINLLVYSVLRKWTIKPQLLICGQFDFYVLKWTKKWIVKRKLNCGFIK